MHDTDPGGIVHRDVAAGSAAAGSTIRDLSLGERTWVQSIVRDGKGVRAGGSTVLEAGDRLELVVDVGDVDALESLFSAGRGERPSDPAAEGE
jgi:NhaP-type Na+/H+ and K+/H+ antiporter